jgi:urease accessory protein
MLTDSFQTKIQAPNVLSLLHLADSALPVGGFTYSYGLESAVRHGLLTQKESVSNYLLTYSEQVLSFDFPFVSSSYLWEESKDVSVLFSTFEAMLLNPWVRKASGVVGKNWLKLCAMVYHLEELEARAAKEKWAYDFPIVFGICAKKIGLQYQETLFLFFYTTVRDQISALIRLGAAGPSWAHSELSSLLSQFEDHIARYEPVPYEEAYKTAYLQELAQLTHGRVYSKLFQN